MSTPKLEIPLQLIGIRGAARSGKDTVASYILDAYKSCYRMPFAGPLKDGCAKIFGIPSGDFYSDDTKEITNLYWGVSPREIAQFVGTEFFREQISKLLGTSLSSSFWVQRLAGYLNGHLIHEFGDGTISEKFTSEDSVVIPDVRFQDEYDFITSNNGIILSLTRDGASGKVGIPGHASEAGVQNIHPHLDFPISNNGTLEELYAQVDKAMATTEF